MIIYIFILTRFVHRYNSVFHQLEFGGFICNKPLYTKSFSYTYLYVNGALLGPTIIITLDSILNYISLILHLVEKKKNQLRVVKL